MTTNFPTALDDDTSLHQVVDGVTVPVAAHHNNPKDAIKAMQAKIGIFNTSAPTSLDYRLGHPTTGHNHNGASGQGVPVSLVGLNLASSLGQSHIVTMHKQGSLAAAANMGAPLILPRTMQLIAISGALRRGPSGATTAVDINFGPTSIYQASQGFRPIFPPGATAYRSSATPNQITYPSGAMITMDGDAVGSNDPGQDLNIVFIFRD